MLALFDRVAEHGPQNLPDEISHQVSEGIFEFIRGRLRVFWFYDDGRLVVCTHGLLKKTQKTPQADIEEAKKARDAYFAAKRSMSFVVEECPS